MRQPTGPPNQPGFRTKDYLFGKCAILVDTTGLMLHAVVHAADIQDRDGGALVMAMLSGLSPFRDKVYADGGYQGGKFQAAVKRAINQINVKIVKRSDAVKGF